MVIRTWKVYGIDGHRQRESFSPSFCFYIDLTNPEKGMISVENSDITETNEYSVVEVSARTKDECEEIFWSQISDGIFENSNVGKVLEVIK